MKTFIITASLCLSSFFVFSQKNGYKELQIGKNIIDLCMLKQHKILYDTTSDKYFVDGGDTLSMCGMKVDHIEIKTDDKSSVTEVSVYSDLVTFPNYDTWVSIYKHTLGLLRSNFGQEYYNNIGKDKNLLALWSLGLNDFYMRTEDASTFDTGFKRNYLFAWKKSSTNTTAKLW